MKSKKIIYGVAATVIFCGAVFVYQKLQEVNLTASPLSHIMTKYKYQPKYDSKEQNTPTVMTDDILIKYQIEKPGIYVSFKVGCPTCQSNYKGIHDAVEHYSKSNPVKWVNVDSETGQKFVKEFGLKAASSIILVNEDGSKKVAALPDDVSENYVEHLFNQLKD